MGKTAEAVIVAHCEGKALTADFLPAPSSGIIRSRVQLGQQVQQGQPLLTLHNIYGRILHEMVAPWAGLVAGVRTFSTIDEGDWSILVLRGEN